SPWLGTACVGRCFFFSSRRRHTRFSRDWSSDVCSSDLSSRKSMTAFRVAPAASLALAALLAAGCTSFYEIGIETPIQPKLDVSSFQRVLVVGFIGGGSGEVDANMETVRLLRSQLRSRSQLNVIEAEVAPLADIVKQRQAEKAAAEPTAQPAGE